MRKPKVRELGEAIRAVIRGPITTRFPFEPHVPEPAFRGKPEFHADDCIGCAACAEVCPARCITVTDRVEASPPVRRLELRYDNCIFCGHCELNCSTQLGIRLGKEYDLACFDRTTCIEAVEKELALCEICGSVVAPSDQLAFLADRLGAKAYGHPTMILAAAQRLGLTWPDGNGGGEVVREDVMSITCVGCRRTILMREAWGE